MRTGYGWTTTKGSASAVSGRRVSGILVADGDFAAAHDVKQVRMTYKYARLVN